MKKTGFLLSFLLCCTLAFSQSIYLDAGKNVPADAPQGQPVLSYSILNNNEMSLTITLGAMSPALFSAAVTGTPFDKMEVTTYDEKNKVASKITLTDVIVTAISVNSGSTENVTLSYSKIKIKN